MYVNLKALRFLLFTAAFWCTYSCHPKFKSVDKSKSSDCIYFGKGGGFTGQLFEYNICKNGKILRKEDGEMKFWGRLPENINQQIFSNYHNLHINNLIINNPGNAYYFIGYQQEGKSIHKITWGNNPAPDKEVTLFYNMMLEMIKKFAQR